MNFDQALSAAMQTYFENEDKRRAERIAENAENIKRFMARDFGNELTALLLESGTFSDTAFRFGPSHDKTRYSLVYKEGEWIDERRLVLVANGYYSYTNPLTSANFWQEIAKAEDAAIERQIQKDIAESRPSPLTDEQREFLENILNADAFESDQKFVLAAVDLMLAQE